MVLDAPCLNPRGARPGAPFLLVSMACIALKWRTMSIPAIKPVLRADRWVDPEIVVLEVLPRTETASAAIAWVLVQRHETVTVDPMTQKVLSARIALHYQRLVATGDPVETTTQAFCGSYAACYGVERPSTVNIGCGSVFMDLIDLKGHHVGAYLMGQVVDWAKQWPDAEVLPVKLLEGQGQGEGREIRNTFWRHFGFVFDFADATCSAGRSRVMPCRELRNPERWKANIEVHHLDKYIAQLLSDLRAAQALTRSQARMIQEDAGEAKRQAAHPFVWALGAFWRDRRDQIVTLCLGLVMAFVAYSALMR